jgi:hypothetical protein
VEDNCANVFIFLDSFSYFYLFIYLFLFSFPPVSLQSFLGRNFGGLWVNWGLGCKNCIQRRFFTETSNQRTSSL